MTNFYTEIQWQLSNHCTAECSYCPIRFREGNYPDESWDYIKVVNLLVNHYNNDLNRIIKWNFDGGEPLDLHNIARILNTAKAEKNHITLNTNGGKLWMDWWAIEPAVDNLILTYHYWQNPNLINYIINLFQNKGKNITVKCTVRPTHFDEDMERIETLEEQKQIRVLRHLLFEGEFMEGSRFHYSQEQLSRISGIKPLIKDLTPTPIVPVDTAPRSPPIPVINPKAGEDYKQDLQRKINSNPSYTGQLCNAGIERLYISHLGFVNGSMCRNITLGNIWLENWEPPAQPQVCGMMACMDYNDRQITKFT